LVQISPELPFPGLSVSLKLLSLSSISYSSGYKTIFFPIILSITLVRRKYVSKGKFGDMRKGWLLFQLISFIARIIYIFHFELGDFLFPSAVMRGKPILKCPL